MEEYLTVIELSERVKFARQTIYNLIYRKTFVLGKHYVKPSPKKILFKWSEIEKWLNGAHQLQDTKQSTFNLTSPSLEKSQLQDSPISDFKI